jgi:polar amino acid transport system substrate-binding protein
MSTGPATSHRRRVFSRAVALPCVLGLTVAFAAACSSSPSGGGGSTPTSSSTAGLPKAEVKDLTIISHLAKDPAAAALLPAKFRGGTIKVATDASYAPDEFESANQTIIGWDPEMGEALAKLLGVKFQFVNTAFDSIIPGLQAGRYNMAMSSMGPFPYRVKVVDFVTDFKAGLAFMVRSNEKNIHVAGLSSLCGLTVAAETGSIEALDASSQQKKCPSSKPEKALLYPDQTTVNLALKAGRAQVDFADSPIVAYQVAVSGGSFIQSGPVIAQGFEGIAVPKSEGLGNALTAAMNKLISAGTLKQLLDNWGQSTGLITKSVLVTNPAQVNADGGLTGKS